MNKDFLNKMLETPSVSGREYEVQKVVVSHMKNIADDIKTDTIGDVINIINPESPFKVLLAAHADEIGLTISRILEDGRCYVEEVGSITPGVYVAQRVRVITKKEIIYGAIAKNRNIFDKKVEDKDLVLDIGVTSKEEAEKLVEIGDVIIHDADYREINDNILAARALDDKIGVYTICEALRRAKERNAKVGVYACCTVGEETTKNGANIVARSVNPTCAIVVDVGSDTVCLPSCGNSNYNKLGGGPILGTGVTMNVKLEELARRCAKNKNINLQYETITSRSYTDADSINISNYGVPTTLISIPLRNMHSSAELVNLNDVEDVIELMVEIILNLDENFNFNPIEEVK